MSKKILYVIGWALLAGVFFAMFYFYQTGVFQTFNSPNTSSESLSSPIQVDSAQASIGTPVQLMIPKINVNAPIEKKGLAPDGSIGVPTGPYTVAWYEYGPRPGDPGSAVIAGHYGPWVTGAHSVFDNLNQLKIGDIIYVKDDKGNQLSFKVVNTKVYPANASVSEVFNTADGAHLNLITCNGTWLPKEKTYTDRLVVFTDLVN